MRLPRSAALYLAALAACSAADRSTGPSSANLGIPGSSVAPTLKSAPRPLSGTCTTTVSRLAPPPIEVQLFELTCRLSHLGLTQATLTQTVDVTTGTLSGTGVYVAANGDQLAFTFIGNPELSFTDPTDATVTFIQLVQPIVPVVWGVPPDDPAWSISQGTGSPAGGPIYYAEQVGLERVATRMREFAAAGPGGPGVLAAGPAAGGDLLTKSLPKLVAPVG